MSNPDRTTTTDERPRRPTPDTAEDRAARAESRLFDIVSGLARNADDWEPVAKHGALLEPRAREITRTVLSPEFMARMARSRW